jgi:hypothetical protein
LVEVSGRENYGKWLRKVSAIFFLLMQTHLSPNFAPTQFRVCVMPLKRLSRIESLLLLFISIVKQSK